MVSPPEQPIPVAPGRVVAVGCLLALGAAIAWLPLPQAAILVLGLGATAIALLHPAGAVGLALLSVPVQELVQLPGGLSVTQAALLLVAASLAPHVLAFPERRFVVGALFVPLALFVWALALSAVLTPFSRAEGLRETARWATVPLIYLAALRAVGAGGQEPGTRWGQKGEVAPLPSPAPGALPPGSWPVWSLLACLLLAPAAAAVVGLVQYWFGLGPESFGIGGGRVRAYGTIGQPNSFAGYMNQGWPLAAGVALFALRGLCDGAPRRHALPALLGAGAAATLMLAALLASFSRGGWVGGMAGGAVLVVVAVATLPARLRPLARQALVAAVAGGLILALLGGGGLLPTALATRLNSLASNLRLFDARGADITPANFAVVERMAHLQAGWNMLRSRPLIGVGPGNFTLVYERPPAAGERPISVRPWYESRGHAHNYYLHVAAEAGLFGLGAYLLLIGLVAVQALRAVRAARGWMWRGIAAGGAGVVAAVAAHNLFENLHVLNMGLQLGTIWALLVAAELTGGEEPRS
ncbi:MAG: O-antigen ligase family protein [Chloroflexi bacterium OHK40]